MPFRSESVAWPWSAIDWLIQQHFPLADPYPSQAPLDPHTLNAKAAKGLRATLGTLAAFVKSTLFKKLTMGGELRMRV